MNDSNVEWKNADDQAPRHEITAKAGRRPEAEASPDASPVVPGKAFQEEAFAYVTQWCRASHDYVSRKVARWRLLEDLYHNRRDQIGRASCRERV